MQANKSMGILHKQNWRQEPRVFCTLTQWESKEAMLRFRNSDAHLNAMKISAKLGQGIVYGWETEQRPSPKEAYEALLKKKKLA
jgi:heme-degrading monooxygenase HmoA